MGTTETPVVKKNYVDIANEVSYGCSIRLSAAIKAGITAGSIPQFVDTKLNNGGLDVNNDDVQTTLDLLEGQGALQTGDAQSIKDLGQVFVPKFPNLSIGHIQTARQLATKGEFS